MMRAFAMARLQRVAMTRTIYAASFALVVNAVAWPVQSVGIHHINTQCRYDTPSTAVASTRYACSPCCCMMLTPS